MGQAPYATVSLWYEVRLAGLSVVCAEGDRYGGAVSENDLLTAWPVIRRLLIDAANLSPSLVSLMARDF